MDARLSITFLAVTRAPKQYQLHHPAGGAWKRSGGWLRSMRSASAASSAARLGLLVNVNSSRSQDSPGASASPSVSSTTSIDFGRRKKRPLKRWQLVKASSMRSEE